jgi:hypothetical protein
MTKQAFFKMPIAVIFSLLEAWVKPHVRSLSGMFAWRQPDFTDTVTLSGAYAQFAISNNKWYDREPIIRVRDLLPVLNSEEARDVINILRSYDLKLRDMIPQGKLDAIFHIEQISVPFASMDVEHRALYRYAVMFVNLLGEALHEFAIYTLDALAAEYWREECANDWRLYETSDDIVNAIGEILEVLDTSELNHFSVDYNQIDLAVSEYQYAARKQIESIDIDSDIREYVEGLEEFETSQLIERLTAEDDIPSYREDDILSVILAAAQFVRDAWNAGDLLLVKNEHTPDIARRFIETYEAQGVFPTLENLDEVEND